MKAWIPVPGLTRFIGVFKQQNLEAEEQFKIFAEGLVCVFVLTIKKY